MSISNATPIIPLLDGNSNRNSDCNTSQDLGYRVRKAGIIVIVGERGSGRGSSLHLQPPHDSHPGLRGRPGGLQRPGRPHGRGAAVHVLRDGEDSRVRSFVVEPGSACWLARDTYDLASFERVLAQGMAEEAVCRMRRGLLPVEEVAEEEREGDGFKDVVHEAGGGQGALGDVGEDGVEEFWGESVHCGGANDEEGDGDEIDPS
ncbi:hypothetical protein MBM_05117 [Drepanopeziza brunnea f. sp. 'multigermtubi' MB_m1]|uniref:Uncharacterized protein n=1 Tax=Marssonina brunnea f. sp. multigermtubi (strain MB_m1) TaxID=1072389 RepID=K1X7R8_MARBU|nr:uncharacterized protein MBM_05117 [Drepanopeziza brunnea f. sp. 'multigermtubi' MB_m1]EKD16648.1 hypothetical protein MBM_05117 [Drepanopeziza brunnea f. sp. 'multigermtubi' MB_m1]